MNSRTMKSATLRQAQCKLRRNCSELKRTLNGASQHHLNNSTKVGYIINTSNNHVGPSLLFSCNGKKQEVQAMFEALDGKTTGINFTNKLTPTPQFNMFKYMYFYNGAGVGVGDFNNDGLSDFFFASNQGENKIYLNEGN